MYQCQSDSRFLLRCAIFNQHSHHSGQPSLYFYFNAFLSLLTQIQTNQHTKTAGKDTNMIVAFLLYTFSLPTQPCQALCLASICHSQDTAATIRQSTAAAKAVIIQRALLKPDCYNFILFPYNLLRSIFLTNYKICNLSHKFLLLLMQYPKSYSTIWSG